MDLVLASAAAAFGLRPADSPIATASKNAPGSASRGFALSSIRNELILATIRSNSPSPIEITPNTVSKDAPSAERPRSSEKITATIGRSKIKFAVALGEANAIPNSANCLCCALKTSVSRSRASAK